MAKIKPEELNFFKCRRWLSYSLTQFMSEGSTTGQKQCEQILSKLAEPKFNTLAIRDPLMPAIEWALLRLNHFFLIRDDFLALKLSR